VEIPDDDDAPPPEWGQWGNWRTPVPEPAVGVLVIHEDGCVMPRHPMHGVEASSSRAALPATDDAAAHPEQELWQEFCDHGASLNNTVNEALRIHAGPAWRVF
jgi:hypothetical protein